MIESQPGEVTAYLAEVRERNSGPSVKFGTICTEDVPRLLAAVEAVRKIADKLPPQGPPSSAPEEDRMWIRQECADMICEAIRSALLGEGET